MCEEGEGGDGRQGGEIESGEEEAREKRKAGKNRREGEKRRERLENSCKTRRGRRRGKMILAKSYYLQQLFFPHQELIT